MQFSASQIANMIHGVIEGDENATISFLAKIEEAKEGELSFLANPKYNHYIYTTAASIVIVPDTLKLEKPVQCTLIRVKDAYSAFSSLLDLYNGMRLAKVGVEQPSFIHEEASLGKDVYVGAFAYIGKGAKIGDRCKIYPNVYIGDRVVIGNDTTLFPGVSVYYDCVIGQNVIVHAGVVIGSDGFGFAPQPDGSYVKVSQIGNVIIEDRVEIGANTVIDRATMGSTIIRQGVKLDNFIQIAHNVEIGQDTVIAAQTGISGSTKVGKNVIIGGQVGLVGHINIADGSQIQAQSGVNKSIQEPGKKWGGTPAAHYNSHLRSHVVYLRLPELEKRIEELEKRLATAEK
jgi:UDP-3-O-[3-hydroxymyristoyl] glucosamine N-acyltransferase